MNKCKHQSVLKCEQVPVGQIGEVCIQGPNVTKGYLNNPKANAEAYAGGEARPSTPSYV